jgi:processive 1,2-diacylglycerol beta-glucosyltransferase
MRVIIVYASAGAGHKTAAEAIYNHLKEYRKDIQVDLADILDKSHIFFKASYCYGYSFLINYAPILWRLGFWATDSKVLRPFTRAIASFLNRLNTRVFTKFLLRENPHCIISTHFLSSEICAYLKRKKKISSKVVTVITDFGVHPFWISEGTDLYIAASDFTKEILTDEGVKESAVRVLGIPVNTKFLEKFNKAGLLVKFNLAKNKFTVLVVTGSFGMGPIEEIADALYQQAQILVVCAKNKKLFEILKRKNYPSVRVFGFIDNIQELMAVSDVIITKPGGLSIVESLVMGLLPIFIVPIPGQETENIKVLAKYGLDLETRDVHQIKERVLYFRDHPDKLKELKEVIDRIKKPFAVRDICDVIC